MSLHPRLSGFEHGEKVTALGKAQNLFFFFDAGRSKTGVPGYASSLAELVHAGFIGPEFAVPAYDFEFAVGLYTFQVIAKPIERTGLRSFYVDETGILLGADVGAGCADPVSMPEI